MIFKLYKKSNLIHDFSEHKNKINYKINITKLYLEIMWKFYLYPIAYFFVLPTTLLFMVIVGVFRKERKA
jgi:hypothetical protein